jgi:hypothetical protein
MYEYTNGLLNNDQNSNNSKEQPSSISQEDVENKDFENNEPTLFQLGLFHQEWFLCELCRHFKRKEWRAMTLLSRQFNKDIWIEARNKYLLPTQPIFHRLLKKKQHDIILGKTENFILFFMLFYLFFCSFFFLIFFFDFFFFQKFSKVEGKEK